ncbi:MAG: hypothetical protein LBH54_02235 [Clostridiales bacterium]|jgi:hypothetical protein|nr:hypothetical protein [Clostridiales bacterium]
MNLKLSREKDAKKQRAVNAGCRFHLNLSKHKKSQRYPRTLSNMAAVETSARLHLETRAVATARIAVLPP